MLPGVAENSQGLAFAQIVAERPGKHLDNKGGGLGQSFDQADNKRTRAQCANQKQGKQTVDHLRRDVHEHAYQAENPNTDGEPLGWNVRGHDLFCIPDIRKRGISIFLA